MSHIYKKSEMVYANDYAWTAYGNDDPKITGPLDQTLFNRKEGYEILYVINKLNLDTVSDCETAEDLIHDELPPSEKFTQKEIFHWLKDNM